MEEKICLALELDNRVMGRPSKNGLQDAAAIDKRPKRTRAGGIAQKVRIPRRVREVVGVSALVQPRSLKEASVVVVTLDRLASLRGQNDELLHLICKLAHIGAEPANPWPLGTDTLAADFLGALPRWIEDVVALLVALELAAPEAAKVEVCLAIVVDETGRVDAVAALDRFRIRGERTLGLVPHGDTDTEDALLVAGWKVEIVFAVLLGGIRRPKLLGHPRNVFCLQHHAVICDLPRRAQAICAEYVVVGHVILVAIVVELDICLAVMGRIDVDLAVKDMRRGVGSVNMSDEGGHLEKSIRVCLERVPWVSRVKNCGHGQTYICVSRL